MIETFRAFVGGSDSSWQSGERIILLLLVEEEEDFIVIITPIHNESSFPEKRDGLSDRIKCDGIYRFVIFLSRRMEPGKNTDGMLMSS